MADRKISDLTALTTPATGDLIPIVDISEAAAADKNKSITVGELLRGAPDGTAAAPGIAFESDGGNGMFLGGTDILAFSTGGSQAVTIDASQRVGLGTSSPSTKLHVNSADSSATYLRVENTSGQAYFGVDGSGNTYAGAETNDAFGLVTNGSYRMYITSGGNVGIGSTAPQVALQIGNYSGNNQLAITSGSSTGTGAVFFGDGTGADLYRGYVQYYHVNDSLEIGTAGTGRLTVDSSGRVLVGTSSSRSVDIAGAALQVEGTGYTSSSMSLTCNATAAYPLLYLARSRNASVGGNTIVQSGDYLGGVLFAGNNGSTFDVGAKIEGLVDGTPGASGDMPGRLVFSTTADGASSPTERMRIKNDGSVFVNTTSAIGSGLFSIKANSTSPGANGLGIEVTTTGGGNTGVVIDRSASDGDCISFTRSGTLNGKISISGGSTTYATTSDYRLKENVIPLTGATDRLKLIPVHRFNFIADPNKTVDGFIAHEAQEVVPECVIGTKDEVDDDGNPVYQGIDQSKLVPLLTAALQEALAKIETLEARVTALEP